MEIVEEPLSLVLQEIMVKLKRNMETMKSICLTWLPISGFVEPNIYHQSVCFTRMRGFYLEVSDSEELVGVITGDEGVCIRVYS